MIKQGNNYVSHMKVEWRGAVPASAPYYQAFEELVKDMQNKERGLKISIERENLGYTCFSCTYETTITISSPQEEDEETEESN